MFDEGGIMEGYQKHSFRIKEDSEYQKRLNHLKRNLHVQGKKL